ncbi:MAG: hypothetical protein R3A80_06630 [Bdellovibrionota bacterium]
MVRVENLLSFKKFMFLGLMFLLGFRAEAGDPVIDVSAENPVLKEVARKHFKLTRVNSDRTLKEWADKAKVEAADYVKKLREAQIEPELIASTEAALDSLRDPEYALRVVKTLQQIDRKGWEEVFKDAEALMNQKNLRLGDLTANPKIIKAFLMELSTKEKSFWTAKTKKTSFAPITETAPVVSVPTGSFEEGLKLIKALSSFVKIEVEPTSDNLLLRYFLEP